MKYFFRFSTCYVHSLFSSLVTKMYDKSYIKSADTHLVLVFFIQS